MPITMEEQEVIVRGSPEYKEFMRHRFGWIKGMVNGFEERLAISGRAMLLVYVAYITVKAGVQNSLHMEMPPLLDIFMLAIQVLGLEGSVPGLIHLSEDLESKSKKKEARMVKGSAYTAQTLAVATAVDIVLQSTHAVAGYNIDDFTTTYSNGLFILRVLIIGMYLIAMARLEHKGPKIISAHEAAKQAQAVEQKQIRIDNGNILATVEQAIAKWASTQPNVNAAFSESIHRLESIVSQKIESTQQTQNEKIESTHRLVEALQFGSSPSASTASLESILPQIESMLSQQVSQVESTLSQRIESIQRDVKRQVSRPEPTPQTKTSPPVERKTVERKTAQELPLNITPIDRGGLTMDEVIRLIEADASLVNLSDAALGQKVGSTKSTANRAKKKWFSTQGESTQQDEAEELEAVN